MLAVISRILFAISLCSLILFGCNKSTKLPPSEFSTIQGLSTNLKSGIEKKDAQNISRFLADDVVLYNVTTVDRRQGKEAVLSYFTENLAGLKGGKLQIASKGVRVLSADMAIERGSAKISQKGQPSQRIVWKAEYKKAEGMWKLYKLTFLTLHKPFSNFEHLKSLAWLAGKWKCDDGDYKSIASYIRWDKSKNFLINHFSLTILDQHELLGVQIIGWDPLHKQVFSWTYDSKGGFGSAKWVQQDDTWYAHIMYTMNDARLATVTHVYKKVDMNTYEFSSENREIDGVFFPNWGPVSVKRRG